MEVLFILNKALSEDPRAQREASALAEAGMRILIVGFRDHGTPFRLSDRIKVRQFWVARRRGSRCRYLYEFSAYLVFAAVLALAYHVRSRLSAIQVFVMPEWLVLAAILPRALGVPVVLDWMDPSLEIYQSKYHGAGGRPVLSCVRMIERLAVWLADLVLVPNRGFCRAFRRRGLPVKKMRIVLNSADERVFSLVPPGSPNDRELRVLYSGTISQYCGVQTLVKAVLLAVPRAPGMTLTIVGDGPGREEILRTFAGEPGFSHIRYVGRVSLSQVAVHLRECDVGVIPNTNSPFTQINLPTRIFEFGLAGKPVLCARLSGIAEYFSADCLAYFEPDDATHLAGRLLEFYHQPAKRVGFASRLQARCRHLAWEEQKRRYTRLITRLSKADVRAAPAVSPVG